MSLPAPDTSQGATVLETAALLAQLHRVRCDPALLAHRFPPPQTTETLILCLRELGFKATRKKVTAGHPPNGVWGAKMA